MHCKSSTNKMVCMGSGKQVTGNMPRWFRSQKTDGKKFDWLILRKWFGDYRDDSNPIHMWCCSNKTVPGSISDPYNAYCDCKHKGEKVSANAGSQCCSSRAVLKDGVAVCAGIPPLVGNQPLFQDYDADTSMLHLNVSDCQFPKGGAIQEVSERIEANREYWDPALPNKMMMCGRRPCQRHNSKPTDIKEICCAGSPSSKWDRDHDDKTVKCGCGHYQEELSSHVAATESDCCSGSYVSGTKCGCIPDSAEKPPSAVDSDCCSGKSILRYNKSWCMTEKCTPQGKAILAKGENCCSRKTTGITKNENEVCGCVRGGVAPVDKLASRCCSKIFLKDNKTCAWIPTKGDIKIWFNETECFSGGMTGDNKCRCMAPFSTLRSRDILKQHSDQCCSGYLVADAKSPHVGYCGCIKAGRPLGYGSDESHCCSGKAENGVCLCTPPGGKFRSADGMTKKDCCSSRATELFCLCAEKNTTHGNACCGGRGKREGNEGSEAQRGPCPCIPDGHLVPTSERGNPDAVCCSKQSSPKCPITCGNDR